MSQRFHLHLIFFSALFVLGSIPGIAEAKRRAPEEVKAVTIHSATLGNVTYSAPNDDGRHGIVRATEAATGKILWKKVVFSNIINPLLEEDVQWVFIRELRPAGADLLVITERWEVFRLDLSTGAQRSLKVEASEPIHLWRFAGLTVCTGLAGWLVWNRIRRRRSRQVPNNPVT
jgi:hypothetical protein